MKKLSKDEVLKVANLANLQLKTGEIEKLTSQLSETITYVDKLNEIDTSNTVPTSQVTGLENIFRDDDTAPSLNQAEATSSAKSVHNGYFKVKAVIVKEKL